jgi:hypothetical protein
MNSRRWSLLLAVTGVLVAAPWGQTISDNTGR